MSNRFISRRILITGASIAGITVTRWLGRASRDVTAVERSLEFRDGGQHIDVGGVGREVQSPMGLGRVALGQGTGAAIPFVAWLGFATLFPERILCDNSRGK